MKNILYVTPKQLYNSKMSIGRRLYVGSLKDAGCSVRCIGPGWEGWNPRGSIADFIDREVHVYHEPYPDAIIAYKSEEVKGLDDVQCPVACCFNEANDRKKTVDDLESTKATDVFFHHAGDYAQWMAELARIGIRSHLIHHCAPENPHGNRPYEDRDIDIGLCGVISPEIYPIRTRFAESGICTIRKHPGYRIPNVVQQYDDYMEWLSRVKVLICCSSRYKYPLAKIHEGLAAGCTVISDKPLCPFLSRIPYLDYIKPDKAAELVQSPQAAVRMRDNLLSLGSLAEKNGGPEKSLQQWERQFTMRHWADNFRSAMGLK